MSNVRNFCISINLCLWFNDHRHRARIFINENILTISDLEKRIEDIFKIKNFHLTSQNEYLPSSEDVRILQPKDVVWVMQNSCEEESLPRTAPDVVMNNPENVVKNKKRSISVTQDYTEQDTHPVKKKKKKKHELEQNRDTEYASPPKEELKKKKKHKVDDNSALKYQTRPKVNKVKNILNNNLNDSATADTSEDSCNQDRSGTMNINTLLPVLQSHIKSYNNKVNKKTIETETGSSFLKSSSTPLLIALSSSQSESDKDSQKVYQCKGTLQSYKKKEPLPTITDKYLQKKRINLVKIECLSKKPDEGGKADLTENKGKIQYENKDNSTCNYNFKNTDSGIDNSMVFTPEKILENCKDPSMAMFKQTQIFSTEKEDNSNQSNTAVANEKEDALNGITKNKDLNNIVTEETVNITDSNKSLINVLDTKNTTRSLLTKDKKYTYLNVEDELISNKSIDPLCRTDISFKENKFEPSSCYAVQKISDKGLMVENIVETCLNNGQSSVDNLVNNQNEEKVTGDDVTKNISTVNKNISNTVENLSKEFETNVCNENISEIPQKVSTEGPTIGNEMMTLSDSNKNLDIDLTEDVLNSLSDASPRTCGSSSKFSRRKQISGQLLGELRSNESLVTGESVDSDHSEFVTKRSRKRIRKRKKKDHSVNNTPLSDNSFVENCDYVPKPIKTRGCPTIHLKFEEEEGEHLKVVDISGKVDKSRENNESNMEISGIENITIDSDVEPSNIENFALKEEYIIKSPSIKNSLPKVGDIIAFKILRISENYTPEVSSYIIGKVIEFNNDNKAVLYDILNGIELTPEEADQNYNCNKREFIWTDIIDPRLLYP